MNGNYAGIDHIQVIDSAKAIIEVAVQRRHYHNTKIKQKIVVASNLTSLVCRFSNLSPYFATTGFKTSAMGLVGLALTPTERPMGTISSRNRVLRSTRMSCPAENQK